VPLPCKPGRTTGCNYFALLRSHFPLASAKTCYALSSTQRPPLFCPLSPEAYLLTGTEKEFPTKNKPAPYLALATGFLNVYLKKS